MLRLNKDNFIGQINLLIFLGFYWHVTTLKSQTTSAVVCDTFSLIPFRYCFHIRNVKTKRKKNLELMPLN